MRFIPQGGRTPLHLAALQGKIGVMKQLLDARAPANASDEHGMTPLHKAAVGGRTEAAQLLLNAGASYNSRLKVGFCAVIVDTLSFTSALILLTAKPAQQTHPSCVWGCSEAHFSNRLWKGPLS